MLDPVKKSNEAEAERAGGSGERPDHGGWVRGEIGGWGLCRPH